MSNPTHEKNYQSYNKGYRYDKNGWTFVHIEGEPLERGEQYGYLVRDKYEKILNAVKEMTYQLNGISYDYLAKKAVELTKDKIPQELLEEMTGFAKGLTKAGLPSGLDDIIAWNANADMSYWWAAHGRAAYINDGLSYTGMPANNYGTLVKGPGSGHYPDRHGHCSAFIATGSATRDKKIVIAHETFDDFWNAGVLNIILDLKPTEGARIYQGFLSATHYHRWNAPLTGTLVRSWVQPGTYFAQRPGQGENPGTWEGTESQPYLGHVAARAVFIFKHELCGYVAFICIGMVEVSTCVIYPDYIVEENESVTIQRGIEIGHFEFGGSTHMMVFQRGRVRLEEWAINAVQTQPPIQMGTVIAKSIINPDC